MRSTITMLFSSSRSRASDLRAWRDFREWRRQYPADLKFHLRRINHRGDLVVTEYLISYNGTPWMFTVSIMEFVGERVARERIYIMDGFEAAEWRSSWRSGQPADPAPPPP